MKKIRAGIAGGAGYTGGELIRLLVHHPQAEVAFVQSKSHAGQPVSLVHSDLAGETEMKFSDHVTSDIDVLFLCAGHGDASKFLTDHPVEARIKIIDLSHDFRLSASSVHGNRTFVYGLPELNREQIRKADSIANPGCFATAIQLGLLPLAKAGILTDIYTTGITGSTGAGQGMSQTSHFSWRANNIQAYKTLTHQHVNEIEESLSQLQKSGSVHINFIPWRGDFTRGIFVSSQLKCGTHLNDLLVLYNQYYESHLFVTVSIDSIFLKQVVNTNKCMIQLEKQGEMLVVHSAIDNLLKGASGQAVQNMNLMFGLDEKEGIRLKASYF